MLLPRPHRGRAGAWESPGRENEDSDKPGGARLYSRARYLRARFFPRRQFLPGAARRNVCPILLLLVRPQGEMDPVQPCPQCTGEAGGSQLMCGSLSDQPFLCEGWRKEPACLPCGRDGAYSGGLALMEFSKFPQPAPHPLRASGFGGRSLAWETGLGRHFGPAVY